MYEYDAKFLNIFDLFALRKSDDCWGELNRDEKGNLRAKSSTFPSGIKALSDYVHSRGLKLGIYSDAG